MNYNELNERLAAAGAPLVYFAKYSPRANPPEYATGDYTQGVVSIVDRGKYLVVGTSERSTFLEMPQHFRSESDAFDFVLKWMTEPMPPKAADRGPRSVAGSSETLRAANEWLEARRRERDAENTP